MQYLNPSLDPQLAHDALARNGRVLIRDFFDAGVADALYRALQGVDWALSFRDGQGDALLSGEALRRLDDTARAALTATITEVAEQGFQFSFFSHSLVHAAQAGQSDLLTRFVRWMADEPFLDYMRRLTGVEPLNRLYAQATMYASGSFLRLHDDQVSSEIRRVAYVLNLTRDWRADWGGLLHFCDEQNNVVDTFVPHFNSLSLFMVPQNHYVSYVAPFAPLQRYAITGWLIQA